MSKCYVHPCIETRNALTISAFTQSGSFPITSNDCGDHEFNQASGLDSIKLIAPNEFMIATAYDLVSDNYSLSIAGTCTDCKVHYSDQYGPTGPGGGSQGSFELTAGSAPSLVMVYDPGNGPQTYTTITNFGATFEIAQSLSSQAYEIKINNIVNQSGLGNFEVDDNNGRAYIRGNVQYTDITVIYKPKPEYRIAGNPGDCNA